MPYRDCKKKCGKTHCKTSYKTVDRGYTPAESKVVENHLYGVGIQQSVVRAREELTKVWDEVPTGEVSFEPITINYTE